MIRIMKPAFCVALWCLLLGMHCASEAAQYRASVIANTQNGVIACATGISNSGIVLGSYGGANPTGFFLWTQAGVAVEIDATDAYFRGAPNASGQIIGTRSNGAGGQYAIVRDPDGTIRQLNYLNASDLGSDVYAVSDSGSAIGYSADESSARPVMWDLGTGSVIQIGEALPGELGGGLGTSAISASGYAAWTYLTNRRYPDGHTGVVLRSFRLSPSGVVTEFPTPLTGGDWFATDVANDGTVLVSRNYPTVSYLWNPDGTLTQPAIGVGAMSDSGLMLGTLGGRRVVLGTDGSLSDLPLPDGATSMRVADINDDGVVVGWAEFADPNDVRAVVWQPVPEPSAFLALACGLVGILTQTRKRRSA